MEENKTQPIEIAPLIYFVATAAIAMIMFIATLVAWLTELTGSATWATLIVGGFFLFVAWLIYTMAVRRSIEYIRDRLDTIYDVAYTVRHGYRAVKGVLRSVLDEIMSK